MDVYRDFMDVNMDVYGYSYFYFLGFYGILAMFYRIFNGLDGILCFFDTSHQGLQVYY